MTCIAALVSHGEVYMAADTACYSESRTYHHSRKLFTLPVGNRKTPGIAFGFAGLQILGELTRRQLRVPNHTADLTTEAFMAEIAESICRIAAEAKPAALDSDGWVDGECIVGYKGEVWTLSQQSANRIDEGYTAIGSGGEVAVGYLHAMFLDPHPETVVANAVRAAAYHCKDVAILDVGPQLLTI